MNIQHPEIGVCGLSCRLCPTYNAQAASRCAGCKTPSRMAVGCPFITCAVKKRGIEFCWDCPESSACDKWRKHRDAGRGHDSFKCYQKLEADIAFVEAHGIEEFEKQQESRLSLLKEMLGNYDNGRSKSYYCIAATVLELGELRDVLSKAADQSKNLAPAEKAKVMHRLLDSLAEQREYLLKLRK